MDVHLNYSNKIMSHLIPDTGKDHGMYLVVKVVFFRIIVYLFPS